MNRMTLRSRSKNNSNALSKRETEIEKVTITKSNDIDKANSKQLQRNKSKKDVLVSSVQRKVEEKATKIAESNSVPTKKIVNSQQIRGSKTRKGVTISTVQKVKTAKINDDKSVLPINTEKSKQDADIAREYPFRSKGKKDVAMASKQKVKKSSSTATTTKKNEISSCSSTDKENSHHFNDLTKKVNSRSKGNAINPLQERNKISKIDNGEVEKKNGEVNSAQQQNQLSPKTMPESNQPIYKTKINDKIQSGTTTTRSTFQFEFIPPDNTPVKDVLMDDVIQKLVRDNKAIVKRKGKTNGISKAKKRVQKPKTTSMVQPAINQLKQIKQKLLTVESLKSKLRSKVTEPTQHVKLDGIASNTSMTGNNLERKSNDSIKNTANNVKNSSNSPQHNASNKSPQRNVSNNSPQHNASNNSPQRNVSNNSPQHNASNNSPQHNASNNSPQRNVSKNSPQRKISNNIHNNVNSNSNPMLEQSFNFSTTPIKNSNFAKPVTVLKSPVVQRTYAKHVSEIHHSTPIKNINPIISRPWRASAIHHVNDKIETKATASDTNNVSKSLRTTVSEKELEKTKPTTYSVQNCFGFIDDDSHDEDDINAKVKIISKPTKKVIKTNVTRNQLPVTVKQLPVKAKQSEKVNIQSKQLERRSVLPTVNVSIVEINENQIPLTDPLNLENRKEQWQRPHDRQQGIEHFFNSNSKTGTLNDENNDNEKIRNEPILFETNWPERQDKKIFSYSRVPKRKVATELATRSNADNTDNETNKRKNKKMNPKDTEHEKALKKFEENFRQHCEEVEQYDLILECSTENIFDK